MAHVERFTLPTELWHDPDIPEWADLHRMPTRGQREEVERLSRIAARGDTPTSGTEYAVVTVLVTEWHVLDADGKPCERKPDGYRRVPTDKWDTLWGELQAIFNGSRPAEALEWALSALRQLEFVVRDPEHQERLTEIMGELPRLAGATDPNRSSQAGQIGQPGTPDVAGSTEPA